MENVKMFGNENGLFKFSLQEDDNFVVFGFEKLIDMLAFKNRCHEVLGDDITFEKAIDYFNLFNDFTTLYKYLRKDDFIKALLPLGQLATKVCDDHLEDYAQNIAECLEDMVKHNAIKVTDIDELLKAFAMCAVKLGVPISELNEDIKEIEVGSGQYCYAINKLDKGVVYNVRFENILERFSFSKLAENDYFDNGKECIKDDIVETLENKDYLKILPSFEDLQQFLGEVMKLCAMNTFKDDEEEEVKEVLKVVRDTVKCIDDFLQKDHTLTVEQVEELQVKQTLISIFEDLKGEEE